MIISRLAESEVEFDLIDKLLEKELNIKVNSKSNDVVYLIKENETLLGTCILTIQDDKAVLNNIFVKQPYRRKRIGDGLLRASLNHVLSKGIEKAYYHDKNQFLVKEGFFNDIEENTCDLDKFFSSSCCGEEK